MPACAVEYAAVIGIGRDDGGNIIAFDDFCRLIADQIPQQVHLAAHRLKVCGLARGMELSVPKVAGDAVPGDPAAHPVGRLKPKSRSEEHTSELQSQIQRSYAVF